MIPHFKSIILRNQIFRKIHPKSENLIIESETLRANKSVILRGAVMLSFSYNC